MRKKIVDAIREAVHADQRSVTEETIVANLIMDSMDMVEIFAVLSTRFKATIEPSEMRHIKTVGDLVDYTIENQGKARGEKPLTIF